MDIPDMGCGIEFIFPPDAIILHQKAYRKYFVQHLANHPVHPMKVSRHLSPINDNFLTKISADALMHSDPWYSEYYGMLNWLLHTGPEITPSSVRFSADSSISPPSMNPQPSTFSATSTRPYRGITFDCVHEPLAPPELVQYVDAEYGRNKASGKSDEGQIICLNGNIVSWSMKGQTMVAHSTYEAEIIALFNRASKLLKIRNYIDGCGFELGPNTSTRTTPPSYATPVTSASLAPPDRSTNICTAAVSSNRPESSTSCPLPQRTR